MGDLTAGMGNLTAGMGDLTAGMGDLTVRMGDICETGQLRGSVNTLMSPPTHNYK